METGAKHTPGASGGMKALKAGGDSILRLAGLVKESVVDGPGLRAVVFVQGCPHHCPGCHNPETWPFDGGYAATVDEVWAEIKDLRLLRGVTFSGGEPFIQAGPLSVLAGRIKAAAWDLIVYSGYTWEELTALGTEDPAVSRLLSLADYLVDGPFRREEQDFSLAFRGSRNQRPIDLRRSEKAGVPVLWEV